MKTLDEMAQVFTSLSAPMAAHACSYVQVLCKGQPLEYQLARVDIDRNYLLGYQAALKDVSEEDHARVIEAIDDAMVSFAAYRYELKRPL